MKPLMKTLLLGTLLSTSLVMAVPAQAHELPHERLNNLLLDLHLGYPHYDRYHHHRDGYRCKDHRRCDDRRHHHDNRRYRDHYWDRGRGRDRGHDRGHDRGRDHHDRDRRYR
ncbi:MAG: hypothetical protein ABW095_17215 [Candidatus Thiodiazotropha sp.]